MPERRALGDCTPEGYTCYVHILCICGGWRATWQSRRRGGEARCGHSKGRHGPDLADLLDRRHKPAPTWIPLERHRPARTNRSPRTRTLSLPDGQSHYLDRLSPSALDVAGRTVPYRGPAAAVSLVADQNSIARARVGSCDGTILRHTAPDLKKSADACGGVSKPHGLAEWPTLGGLRTAATGCQAGSTSHG